MLIKKNLRVPTVVLVGFGIAFLIVYTSPSFQSCIYEQQNYKADGTPQENISGLLFYYKVGRYCAGEWLHRHGESIIAFFTVILGTATWLLWRATQNLVEGAEDTAKRQLRAYISCELTSININASAPGYAIEVGYVLTNNGQTPAYRVRTDSNFRTMKFPIPSGKKIIPPDINAVAFAITIGPSEQKRGTLDKSQSVSDTHLADMTKNSERLYVVALITYEDAFGEEWHTEYCASLKNLDAIIAAGKGGTPVPKAIFVAAEQYNHAN